MGDVDSCMCDCNVQNEEKGDEDVFANGKS